MAALIAACVLFTVIKILAPFAEQYGSKYFELAPTYLLKFVLRPFALVLLGWGIAEAAKAFAGIRIWEGRPQRTVKMVRIFFWVATVILAMFAVLALWTAADLTYLWWLSERMMRSQESFDSSTVPRLMPRELQAGYMRVVMRLVVLNFFGGSCLFLGMALGLCRIEKEEPEREAENRLE